MTVAAIVLAAAAASAPLEVVTWSRESLPPAAELVAGGAGGGQASIRLRNPGPGPLEVTLALLRRPRITTPYWSVRGKLRTEAVAGAAYLEMWSTFPDGSAYF